MGRVNKLADKIGQWKIGRKKLGSNLIQINNNNIFHKYFYVEVFEVDFVHERRNVDFARIEIMNSRKMFFKCSYVASPARGQCYDNNFLPFSRKISAFLLKPNVIIHRFFW
jgi:hypothetical protein